MCVFVCVVGGEREEKRERDGDDAFKGQGGIGVKSGRT